MPMRASRQTRPSSVGHQGGRCATVGGCILARWLAGWLVDGEMLICWSRLGPRRPLSPVGSPQPYVPPPVRSSTLFSPPEDDPPPLRADSLLEFVRAFNRGSLPEFKPPPPSEPDSEGPPPPHCKLAVWSRTRAAQSKVRHVAWTQAGDRTD